MCPLHRTPSDFALADLALRQHNAVSRAQLIELGFTARQVKHRCQCGRLHPIYRGVYAVGSRTLGPRGRLWAAHLRAGADSSVSHWSAAWLRRLWHNTGRIQITCPRELRIPQFTTHRGTPSTSRLDGLPVTTWARTIIDCAATTRNDRTIEKLINEAEYREVFDLTTLNAELSRLNGHAGVARTRRALARYIEAPTLTESELEERFLALVDAMKLPRPIGQAGIGPYRVDFIWPHLELVVELDASSHRTAERFETDRERDAELLIRGLRTLRVTPRRLASGRVERELRALTAARAA
jgi:very-short-patch-repair endonuclease